MLFRYMNILELRDGIFIEPSGCAAFAGYVGMGTDGDMAEYAESHVLADTMKQATHIIWATGGSGAVVRSAPLPLIHTTMS